MIPTEQALQADLLLAGISRAMSLISLIILVAVCHFYTDSIQIRIEEDDRIVLRTIFYVLAILTFPIMKFIRHVLLRLNQISTSESSAKSRYLTTIIISMVISESMGIYGFIMYILGDSFNTLYIFVGLSAFAMFLYKPDINEYRQLVESLDNQENQQEKRS